MRNKTAFATIAVFMTALFAATLVISLTAQPTFAICSPKNPLVCTLLLPGGAIAVGKRNTEATVPAPDASSSGGIAATPGTGGCTGHTTGIFKNGQTVCSP
jgi:hypothetical protein